MYPTNLTPPMDPTRPTRLTHPNPDTDPSAALLLVPTGLTVLSCPRGATEQLRTERHTIIAVTEGAGSLCFAEGERKLGTGACVMLQPGRTVRLRTCSAALRCHIVFFDVYAWGESRPLDAVRDGWRYGRPVAVAPLSRLLERIDRLERCFCGADEPAGLWRIRRSTALQELVCLIAELQELPDEPGMTGGADAICATVRWLHTRFREPVTVEQLSRLAGLSRSKYTTAFQAVTGKKPLEYLNDLRIDKASKLLAETGLPLREIAREVGFSDEYYFNKRFARRIGLPPGAYARLSRSPVAAGRPPRIVVTGSALGELLTLGIKPIGAELTVIGSQVVYRELLQDVADVGLLEDTSFIKSLRPDLIVLGCKLERHHARLNEIAPTAILDSSQETSCRLRSLARWVGKRDEALAWIAGYETRCRTMWEELNDSLTVGETATVLLLLEGQLYLMGQSGFAATLYHPKGFRPSAAAGELIANGEPFRLLRTGEVAALDGDRLFVLSDLDAAGMRGLRMLLNGPEWPSPASARHSRVHIAESCWNFDDPVTRDRLLTELPNIVRLSVSGGAPGGQHPVIA